VMEAWSWFLAHVIQITLSWNSPLFGV
jgi:hypothetical protein